MPAETVTRSWREFLRFSVRGLIVIVLATALWLGWLVRSARIQHNAVIAIERAGGYVVYEETFGNKRFHRSDINVATWFTRTLGVDTSCRVWSVRFNGIPSDADMVFLGRLTTLEDLLLTNANVTDAGLVHLASLTRLTHLYLDGTRVTDAGLSHLSGLSRLAVLFLQRTRVSDEGVRALQRSLPSLEIFR
jgi:Leucine Rich repeat